VNSILKTILGAGLLATALGTPSITAQSDAQGTPAGFPGLAANRAPEVEIPWNRLRPYAEILSDLDKLAAQWPDFLTSEVIGHSVEGREMRVYTLNNPSTGSAESKPAMWVDGNVHGNEVQGSEVVVYLAWYLMENYGSNERVTELVDRSVMYLLPSQNPDGRDRWFREANTASSSRTGNQPTDNDRDGSFDEDMPNDLDGDGNIVQMRKYVPGKGTHRISEDDDRVMERVPNDGKTPPGDYLIFRSEGFDDDGDGRINEDDQGGYDMNRAWPSSWQPEHVQFGAGPYPLYWPETSSIARFISTHANIAGAQSFHNSGGMILRGPGAEVYGAYPRRDLTVYDELGQDGEKMLPFYNYMIIWRDLYSVFGGFVNWTYEGLGIISFTNELWVGSRNSPDNRIPGGNEGRHWFDDHLLMSAGFVPWHEVEHPDLGTVEVGGFAKDVGRVPPTFLIEEMLHRNALFCIRHAEEMAQVVIHEPEISDLGNGLTAIDVVFQNTKLIPTRTALAASKGMGVPDTLSIQGEGIEVVVGGIRSDVMRPERMSFEEFTPASIVREDGVGSRERLMVRWIIRGRGEVTLAFTGEKAVDVSRTFSID
jgi:hypothetical protein